MTRSDPIGSLIDRLCHTREELADELGVSPAALYSWSVGRRTPRPGNRSELVRIARMHARELAALAADLDRGGAVPASAPGVPAMGRPASLNSTIAAIRADAP